MTDEELKAHVKEKLEERITRQPATPVQYNIVLPVTQEQAERILKIMEEGR